MKKYPPKNVTYNKIILVKKIDILIHAIHKECINSNYWNDISFKNCVPI